VQSGSGGKHTVLNFEHMQLLILLGYVQIGNSLLQTRNAKIRSCAKTERLKVSPKKTLLFTSNITNTTSTFTHNATDWSGARGWSDNQSEALCSIVIVLYAQLQSYLQRCEHCGMLAPLAIGSCFYPDTRV
jgi:hypothetical protein